MDVFGNPAGPAVRKMFCAACASVMKLCGKCRPPFRGVRRIAARLLPDSLFSRLVFIFSGGFLVFLVLTSVYAEESRHFYFVRGLMADRARKMAENAALLDATSMPVRTLLCDQLNARGFRISFLPAAPAEPSPDEDLREASELMEFQLNLSLSRIYDGTRSVRRGRFDLARPDDGVNIPRRAFLKVNELNLPSPLESFLEPLKNCFSSGPGPRRRGVNPSNRPAYLATAFVPMHDGTWAVVEDMAPGYPHMPEFPVRGILSLELFFVLVSLGAFYICVKPLRRLAGAADRFGRDIPGTPPLPETGPSEVREAAQAFNRMQRSIREFVDERERTLAAVSHDLRTPLTRMRLRVEQLPEEQRRALQKDIGELQQIMDTTIDIARSRSEAEAVVDAASLIESLVEDRQDMGQDIRLSDRLQDPEVLFSVQPVKARPLSMKRCLANLMDNALRYGGSVVVDAADSPEELAVTILDSGPGIPEADLERVFEPFYRVEPSRNRSTGGTGLGLSIARSMARLHGGDVVLANRPEGGLKATATFKRT